MTWCGALIRLAVMVSIGLAMPSKQEKALELLRQRATPGLFAKAVGNGRWKLYPHLQILDRAIIETISGWEGIRRLIVTMPPQHGKSELISKFLTAWYLGTFPDKRIILCGYGTEFASEWGAKSRDVMKEFGPIIFGVNVRSDSKAANHWKIEGREGVMHAAGLIGGDVTGRSADLFIIDDPIKNPEEAASETYRKKTHDAYLAVAKTRLQKGGCIILVQTRWHEDDLAGRLIAAMKAGGEKWRIVNMPAINDRGEALCPDLHPIEELLPIKMESEYLWSALYMQSPSPREGLLFNVTKLGFCDADEVPSCLKFVRAWDMAATANDGDHTAGVKMGHDTRFHKFYIPDVTRGRWATDDRDLQIRLTAGLDGKQVRIRGPQDPGAAGVDAALAFARMLKGHSVKTEPVSGSKEIRADPFSSAVNRGDVILVRGPWNKDFVEELRTFPNGKYDDQVDAASDAYNELNSGVQFLVAR